jgi:hypothetical protein
MPIVAAWYATTEAYTTVEGPFERTRATIGTTARYIGRRGNMTLQLGWPGQQAHKPRGIGQRRQAANLDDHPWELCNLTLWGRQYPYSLGRQCPQTI